MQKFFGLAQDTAGNIIPSASITVNLAGTATLATIYSSNSYAALANPFVADSDGTWEYFAADGRYDVVLVKAGFTFPAANSADILLSDRMSVVSPAQITATQNDYSPTNGVNVALWRINSDATRSITGIVAPTAAAGQRTLTLINVGAFNINLANASGSSTAGNRFTCANGRDYALFPNDGVVLTYDTASTAWRVPYQGPRLINHTVSALTIQNDNTERTYYSVTVPGGLMGASSGLRFHTKGGYTNTTGANAAMIPRLKYGGSQILQMTMSPTVETGNTNFGIILWGTVHAENATNAQGGSMVFHSPRGAAGDNIWSNTGGPVAIDSTVDQTFLVTTQFAVASNLLLITRSEAFLEWLP